MEIPARPSKSERDVAFCTLVAFALVGIVFALQGHVGFGMQDESFLWYGVQRTHAGELPLRDFRSYDPGRYFWCSAWATLFGDGIVAVRAASWIFAGFGLTCGLLAARRAFTNRWVSIPVGILLVMWMSPPWKLFESSLAMSAVFVATRLIEAPSRGRHFVAGVFVGVAAFFGRNLGLYAGLALGVLVLYVAWKDRAHDVLTRLRSLAAGVVLGYLPMLALCAFARGFWMAFVDSVRFYFGQSALNAELPVPWPWRVDYSGMTTAAAISQFTVGAFFLLLVAFYLGSLVPILTTGREVLRRRALFIGAVFVGGFVAHHASVRSDIFHLSQSIHPLLIGLLAAPAALAPRRVGLYAGILLAVLLVGGFYAIGWNSPAMRVWRAEPPNAYVVARIGTDDIRLARNEALSLESFRTLVISNVKPSQSLWVGAQFIGLYPLLGRRSPVWDIYPAWKASDAVQQRMIQEIAGVDWALFDLRPIGGDPNMTLPLSHPLVWQRVRQDFERVPVPGAPESLFFLKRKRG